LTIDQLRTSITYLQEETDLDAEMSQPEFRVLEELAAALNAVESEKRTTVANRQRVEKAFTAAQRAVPAAVRARAGKSYIAALMSVAEQFLSSS
jgi:Ni/Fe-hydrogenase subunit HybB-like protein